MNGNAPAVSTGTKDFGPIFGNRGAVIGDVSGHAQVIESPNIPPSPSRDIPFRRAFDFVDRKTLLGQIHEKCSAPASRVALVGLGGVGKSQLAIEYCHLIGEQSPDTWVFWVHASNGARIEQGYRDIAERVKIPGRQDSQADIFQLVYKWLRLREKRKWVLVLDSADDAAVLSGTHATGQKAQVTGSSGGPPQSLLSYLPQSRNGSILVTTRTKDVASMLVEESEILPVEPMDNAQALALFEKKLGRQIEKYEMDDTTKLVAALEFMPLAIVQAAAYIRETAPRYSIGQYVEDFFKNDKIKTSLLDYQAGHLRRDPEASNSVIITWQTSFDHIHREKSSAADLLSLMSFFDRDGIPDYLLQTRHEPGNRSAEKHAGDDGDIDCENDSDEESVNSFSIKDKFERDITTLRNYSFITASTNGNFFEMHGLVQLATRKWLEAHDQLERWKQQCIKNLCKVYPSEYSDWMKCYVLFPHAQSVVTQQPAAESSLKEWTLILHNAATFAWAKGDYGVAETMAFKAKKTREKMFGQDHIDTLSSMNLLAMIYNERGQWKEAEKLGVQVTEARKKVLGAEHRCTLASMNDLAEKYHKQGRRKEAEELKMQVIDTRKRALGPEHPETLVSIGDLALTYHNQGRWAEAEELYIQVIETSKMVLKADHPITLTDMANLAMTYYRQGRWKKAEELQAQVIDSSMRILGRHHQYTETNKDNLTQMECEQKRRKEVEELGVQVTETERTFATSTLLTYDLYTKEGVISSRIISLKP